MAKQKTWKLDPAEVGLAVDSSTSTRRRKRRLSRSLDLRSQRLRLTHLPTGIAVTDEIPPGHYSRKQMQAAQEKLELKLLAELEAKVARHLRIPGR